MLPANQRLSCCWNSAGTRGTMALMYRIATHRVATRAAVFTPKCFSFRHALQPRSFSTKSSTSIKLPSVMLKESFISSQARSVDVFTFGASGEYSRTWIPVSELLQTCKLKARDIICLQPCRHMPVVHCKEEAIIVKLSHIRAIIQKDQLFLMGADSPVVAQFAQAFSILLQVNYWLCVNRARRAVVLLEGFELWWCSSATQDAHTTPVEAVYEWAP